MGLAMYSPATALESGRYLELKLIHSISYHYRFILTHWGQIVVKLKSADFSLCKVYVSKQM